MGDMSLPSPTLLDTSPIKTFSTNIHLLQSITPPPKYRFQVTPDPPIYQTPTIREGRAVIFY